VQRYADLTVEGIAASYGRGLELASELSPLTLLFLGSTVGNLNNDELDRFLEMVAGRLAPGDHFLLGLDLVKEPAILEAAYNDAAGWTARFTRNLFARMNRELDAGIPLDSVEHVAYYNDRLERIEIHARFTEEVRVDLPIIDESYRIAAGEMILVEISRKFRAREVVANVARFGLGLEEIFTDDRGLFALLMLRRRRDVPVAESRRQLLEARLQEARGRTLGLVQPLRASLDRKSAWSRRIARELDAIAAAEALLMEAGGDEPRCGVCGAGRGSAGEETGEPSGPHEVRRGTMRRLCTAGQRAEEIPAGRRYRWLLEHEGSHQERILELVQQGGDLVYRLPGKEMPPPRPDRLAAGRRVRIPGGVSVRRAEAGLSRRRMRVADFWMDATPVTNGQFLAFLEGGGYDEPRWWSPAGWRWRQEGDVRCPAHWLWEADEWQVRVFGEPRRMDPARPVMHVSWWEADAFARWVGARLPTAAEWERAAGWNPSRRVWQRYPWGERAPDSQLANLGMRLDEPTPVGSYPGGRSFYGCHQMLGDVWEWSASAPADDADAPGANAAAAGPVEVSGENRDAVAQIRGGSWATPVASIFVETRRAVKCEDRAPFVGFRCAHGSLDDEVAVGVAGGRRAGDRNARGG